MAKNVMPVSSATNAYELLNEIATLIVEEPKRYNQYTWKELIANVPEHIAPACGTVCCVAGWVDTLKNPEPIDAKLLYAEKTNHWFDVKYSASAILGISPEQAEVLFDGNAAGDRDPDNYVIEDEDDHWDEVGRYEYDLAGHAERGAAHIRRFMAEHETQLKAKLV